MKKKILFLVLIILITGCGLKKEKPKEILNNVTMSLKENSLTNTGATFILKNNTDKEYWYGEDYYLEIENNGIWIRIEPKENISFNTVAYTLKPNEDKEINVNWQFGYKELLSGNYRLVKKIFQKENKSIDKTKIILIYAEFNIENNKKSLEVVKSNFQDTNKFNTYLEKNNKILYLASNIEEIYYIEGNSKITLKNYFTKSYQTDNDILKHLIELMELVDTLKDGGTTIYKSKDYDVTMINCNTLSGNNDIFIGDYNLEFDNNEMCKR